MEGNPMEFRRFRRRSPTVLAAVIMTGIVAVIGYVLLRVQEPRFGKEKFELIHEGMTEAEVVEALGCPAGDYRPEIWRHPTWFVSSSNLIGLTIAERGRPRLEEVEELQRKAVERWSKDKQEMNLPIAVFPYIEHRIWWAREYGIDVDFDEKGRVIHCALLSLIPPRHPHDPIRWFRWRIGW
jgi:hypothetical protein